MLLSRAKSGAELPGLKNSQYYLAITIAKEELRVKEK